MKGTPQRGSKCTLPSVLSVYCVPGCAVWVGQELALGSSVLLLNISPEKYEALIYKFLLGEKQTRAEGTT